MAKCSDSLCIRQVSLKLGFFSTVFCIFISYSTRMYVVSSSDLGHTWQHELTINAGTDLREPYFLELNGTLFFYYVEAGVNPVAFEPGRMQQRQYLNPGWSAAEKWGQESEIAWQYGLKDGIALTISYAGMHYSLTELGKVNLFLNGTSSIFEGL